MIEELQTGTAESKSKGRSQRPKAKAADRGIEWEEREISVYGTGSEFSLAPVAAHGFGVGDGGSAAFAVCPPPGSGFIGPDSVYFRVRFVQLKQDTINYFQLLGVGKSLDFLNNVQRTSGHVLFLSRAFESQYSSIAPWRQGRGERSSASKEVKESRILGVEWRSNRGQKSETRSQNAEVERRGIEGSRDRVRRAGGLLNVPSPACRAPGSSGPLSIAARICFDKPANVHTGASRGPDHCVAAIVRLLNTKAIFIACAAVGTLEGDWRTARALGPE